MSWLTDELKQEVRNTFEPKYQRKITDEEVSIIAENLTAVMETFLKIKFKQRHENQQAKS